MPTAMELANNVPHMLLFIEPEWVSAWWQDTLFESSKESKHDCRGKLRVAAMRQLIY
jgi:hypothetical protein